jgi:hypothetical protein
MKLLTLWLSQNALMSQLKDLISNEMGGKGAGPATEDSRKLQKLKRRCRADISSNAGLMRNNLNTTKF